jgi:hypothetical protein
MLAKVGARRWIAGIMVVWGIASTCTMFATSPETLYVLRMLVGIAEAGFLPGIFNLDNHHPLTRAERGTGAQLQAACAGGFACQTHALCQPCHHQDKRNDTQQRAAHLQQWRTWNRRGLRNGGLGCHLSGSNDAYVRTG